MRTDSKGSQYPERAASPTPAVLCWSQLFMLLRANCIYLSPALCALTPCALDEIHYGWKNFKCYKSGFPLPLLLESELLNRYQHVTVLGISEVLFPCLVGPSLLAWRLDVFCSEANFARESQGTTWNPQISSYFQTLTRHVPGESVALCKTWVENYFPFIFLAKLGTI